MAAEAGWATPVWHYTTVEDPGTGMAEAAAVAGADLVMVCGGDGTVREVCAELAGTGIPVGIIPAGTGNLLARNLDIPLFLRAAIDIALTGQDRAIDMVKVSGDGIEDTHFMVMAGMGFDAAIMEGVNEEIKAKVGWIAYVLSALKSLMFPAVRLEISVDGGEFTTHRARTIVVGNVGYLQAGMPLLPDAAIDDGLLDVVLLHPRRFLSWIPLAFRVLAKRPRTDELVNRMTGRTIVVRAAADTPRQLDGDSIGPGRELRMECIHGRVLVRVPALGSTSYPSGGALGPCWTKSFWRISTKQAAAVAKASTAAIRRDVVERVDEAGGGERRRSGPGRRRARPASTASTWPPVMASEIRSDWPAAGVPASRGDPVGDLVAEDRAERGDAGGHPDLAEGRVDAGRHPGPLDRTTPTAVEASGVLIMPMADAADEQARDQVGPRRVGSMPGSAAARRRARTKPGAISHFTGTFSVSRPAIAAATKAAPERKRNLHAGPDRGVAEHVLDVDDEVGQQREDRGRDAERGDQATGERRLPQQGQVEHRVLLHHLADHEDRPAAPRPRRGRRPPGCRPSSSWPASIRP